MPEDITTGSQPIPAPEAELLAGTEQRIQRAMWALGAVGTALCWLWQGWGWGAGFAIGAVLSALNFRWMKTAVHVLAEAASSQPPSSPLREAPVPGSGAAPAGESLEHPVRAASEDPPARRSSGGVPIRFLLRYALIGLVGYAIFKSLLISLGAFFLGLFLFIAAILAEIGYQIYCAFRNE